MKCVEIKKSDGMKTWGVKASNRGQVRQRKASVIM